MIFDGIKNRFCRYRDVLFKMRFKTSLDYWEYRANRYGVRSVLNLGHTSKDFDSVTKIQKEILFPLIKPYLTGEEKRILDFGCGPGRFTHDLAKLTESYAIGVDPIQSLIDLAPSSRNVEYRLIKNERIPIETESIDILWACLVFGGIMDEQSLKKAVKEAKRVLKSKGLMILIENTSDQKDGVYWKYRSITDYQQLFDHVALEHRTEYNDLGEKISIMIGRKRV